jgi:succinate dehydrogenase/fumarate reductase flavoprotein subunit
VGPTQSCSTDVLVTSTDVLVIGAGAAGMYAAMAAARAGARVMLVDRSLIGRGGATVMAQMTVAVALGEEEADDWKHHLADTLEAGRGLCDAGLAQLLCEDAEECVREMDGWGVGWARAGGRIRQVQAPGHDRARCVYVDFLNTGPAVSKTLRAELQRVAEVHRTGDLLVTGLAMRDGMCVGAHAVHTTSGAAVSIAAKATIIATGGLTRLYQRNSASANMGGDGYALALRAGAELVDMEFVQFFPIGHLAPRLVGMDPIMWDPFRYKLGGRLLNGRQEEFVERYGATDAGTYTATRDQVTYAILKEVDAGRGSPHGGAYLDFRHVGEAGLREAFGPVIDRLLSNGIDLTTTQIEVSPIAHYHMGGIRVDGALETRVPGLFAAGEAVGGANGANRLSGNAITEALVFGERAGQRAAHAVRERHAPANGWKTLANDVVAMVQAVAGRGGRHRGETPAGVQERLQRTMMENAGPLRDAGRLRRALADVRGWQAGLPGLSLAAADRFNLDLLEWFELRNMLQVAETILLSALRRQESRGAHQREDFPALDPRWNANQVTGLDGDTLHVRTEPLARATGGEAVE